MWYLFFEVWLLLLVSFVLGWLGCYLTLPTKGKEKTHHDKKSNSSKPPKTENTDMNG